MAKRKLPRVKKGDQVTAALFNEMAEAIEKALGLKVSPPLQMSSNAGGMYLSFTGDVGGAVYHGIVSSQISAADYDGTTLTAGTGEVRLIEIPNIDDRTFDYVSADVSDTTTVYNLHASAVATNTVTHLMKDTKGNYFVVSADCSALSSD